MKTILISLIVITLSTNTLIGQVFIADVANSTLKWHGEKVTGDHFGYINLKEGMMEMQNGQISKGKFIIDMTSITNTDLKDETYNTKLVKHLKSEDFFGVEKHPEAILEIKSSTPFKNNEATVNAMLTIKNITHPITFTAKRNGNVYEAEMVVDRSKYDVRYGSGSFFDGLGDRMIYDEFTMNIMLRMNGITPLDS